MDERKLNNPSVALQPEKVVAPEVKTGSCCAWYLCIGAQNTKRNSVVDMLTASLSKSTRSEVSCCRQRYHIIRDLGGGIDTPLLQSYRELTISFTLMVCSHERSSGCSTTPGERSLL